MPGTARGLRPSVLVHLYGHRAERQRTFFGLEQVQGWKNFEAAQKQRPFSFADEHGSARKREAS
jgi:hypothetical protein